MILIAEMQIYKDEEKKARQEAEVLPEKILARKMAQRGLAHSVPPTGNGGGWKRNSERWPATPGPEGKGEKDKGKGKKGKEGKTKARPAETPPEVPQTVKAKRRLPHQDTCQT